MSITVKIKTNNNRVKQLQQVLKAEKQAIYQVELRNRWERYVQSTQQSRNDNLLLEYSQYLDDPATELSMLHKYPNVKALFLKYNAPIPSICTGRASIQLWRFDTYRRQSAFKYLHMSMHITKQCNW